MKSKRKSTITSILADALLIACGVLASVLAVPSAYGAEFFLIPPLCVSLVSALILSAALHLKLKPIVALLPFALVVCVYAVIDHASIVDGARLVWYSLLRPPSVLFTFLPVPPEPEGIINPAACATAFLMVASAVFALIIAPAFIKSKSSLPAVLAPLPSLFLSLFHTNRQPALFIIMLLMLYFGGLVFGRDINRDEQGKSGSLKLFFVALMLSAALLLRVVFPAGGFTPIPYEKRQQILGEGASRIQDAVLALFASNPSEYDLRPEGNRTQSEARAFLINSSYEGSILLRTHSYGLYKDNAFAAAKEYSGTWSPLHALGLTQTGETATLAIRSAYTNERIVPYAFLDGNIKSTESYVRAAGETAYKWTFMPELYFSQKTSSRSENKYYQFALEQYTMPDGTQKDKLLQILMDVRMLHTVQAMIDDDPYGAAVMVANFVRNSGSYTLTPGRTPADRDFVEYFLTESHAGYCVHFASSTTALLQALGIPTRYVVGYLATQSQANTWETVPEKASHAWAEIYIQGVGWIPVESTAGFSIKNGYSPDTSSRPDPVDVPATPTAANTDRPDATIPPDETPVPSAQPAPSASPTAAPTSSAAPTPHGTTRSGEFKGLLWLLTIPAALLIHELCGILIKRLRRRRFNQKDANAAILCMLRYLKWLERFGVPPESDAKALADEAAFSNHSMTAKQKQLQRRVRNVQSKAFRSKPFKRFVMRRILFII